MRDFGGMISFLVESEEEAVELVARTKVWTLAESLGGVESLIEHPARMTHASTADGPFAAPRNLVRLSVGIESADDLVADLEQALAARRPPPAPELRRASGLRRSGGVSGLPDARLSRRRCFLTPRRRSRRRTIWSGRPRGANMEDTLLRLAYLRRDSRARYRCSAAARTAGTGSSACAATSS